MNIDFKEIASKSVEQLKKEVSEMHEELNGLRQKAYTGELKTFHKISQLRRSIARHLTAMKGKEQ